MVRRDRAGSRRPTDVSSDYCDERGAARCDYRAGSRPAYSLGGTRGLKAPPTLGGMRTDRGWRRFYGTGWLVSAAFGVVASLQWQARMREVESRAEARRASPGA